MPRPHVPSPRDSADGWRTWGGSFDRPRLARRVDELSALSADPAFWRSPGALEVAREQALAERTLATLEGLEREATELFSLSAEPGDDWAAELRPLLDALGARVAAEEAARWLGAPEHQAPARLEVHAAAGGADAEDWAAALVRMYGRWAEATGRTVEVVDAEWAEGGGLKRAALRIEGHAAYGWLAGEAGVHRRVRTSPTDGRRQTAFAAVSVVPELDDAVVVTLAPGDYRRETFLAGGKGGQNVNKVETAVRLTHHATGLVVVCRAERSQPENLRLALAALRGKLYARAEAERRASFEARFGTGRGAASFGHQARSYLLAPHPLVKDHRSGWEGRDPAAVLDGALGPLLMASLAAGRRDLGDGASTG